MDGIEATRRIRQLEQSGALREGVRPAFICALTANVGTQDRGCLAAGMSDFLPKPIMPPEARARPH